MKKLLLFITLLILLMNCLAQTPPNEIDYAGLKATDSLKTYRMDSIAAVDKASKKPTAITKYQKSLPTYIYDSHYKEIHLPSTVYQSIRGILNYLYHDKIINEYNVFFEPDTSLPNHAVILKPFTDSVLFIWSSSPEKAKEEAELFNFNDWVTDNHFVGISMYDGLDGILYRAVENARIGKTPLTDLYFLNNFPMPPSNKQTIHDTNSYDIILEYNDLGLTLYFYNGILVRYEKS